MLAWVVDPWSKKYKSALGHVPSQRPKLGAMFHRFIKEAKVLHHRVFRDKGHRLWLDKMVIPQPKHMQ